MRSSLPRFSPRHQTASSFRGSLPGFRRTIVGMIRIGSIVMRVDDLQRQAEFWEAALGYVRRDDGESDDFVLLGPPDGAGPHLSLDQVRSTLQIPPRIHLDLYTDDQAGEVKRLLALGATEIQWDKRPPDADYVILADPEGNRFCVVDISY
jgi:catechol 2,3-dioxygenase-like lactoylglutathione lyase family enzyme